MTPLKHNLSTIEENASVGCPQCECWVDVKDLEDGCCPNCNDNLEDQDEWVKLSEVQKLKEELEQLKQRGNKLCEDKDITRFSRERGILSMSDGKFTIPIDEVLGK